jgi:hypothetical protein
VGLFSGCFGRQGGSDLIPRRDILIPRFVFRDPAGEGGVEEAAKQRLQGQKGKKNRFRIGRSERDAIAG